MRSHTLLRSRPAGVYGYRAEISLRNRYEIIDPVYLKLTQLGNTTFSAGFHFLFSSIACAWLTSRSPQLIFRSRIVIIAYSDRYGIYQWEHALPEHYVTVQHREAPTVCVSYRTGALSLFVVRHTCTHVSLCCPPFLMLHFPDTLLRMLPILTLTIIYVVLFHEMPQITRIILLHTIFNNNSYTWKEGFC